MLKVNWNLFILQDFYKLKKIDKKKNNLISKFKNSLNKIKIFKINLKIVNPKNQKLLYKMINTKSKMKIYKKKLKT